MTPDRPAFSELPSRLESRVRALAHEIGPRHYQRRAALDTTVDYLAQQLAALECPVQRHQFSAANSSFEYLEVLVPPKRHSARNTQTPRSSAALVIGAHYDTVPTTPGADDNATACAALLEFAAQLSPGTLSRPIRLAWYPNEEPPFFPDAGMGSAAHAARLRAEQVPIHLMISLEMLGYFDDRPGSQAYPPGMGWLYPDRGNFIGFVGNLASRRRIAELTRAFRAVSKFPCESLAAPEWTQIVGLSDHSSFWRQGFPGLMVTDTAFMRNPHYHRPTDTADTLDFPRFAAVTQGLIDAVSHLAS